MSDLRPMKYIVFKSADGEAPVLFPHDFTHSWVAAELRPLTVVSAGFCEIQNGRIACFGHSSSLNISSRGAVDAALVQAHLGPHAPVKN